ncbi:uncharacterized protein N7473_007597 [Penicillium subrubescens]|uniref:Uncharacterized protein n=1 Tax=Penicillium subrubescens TaxID=1316194 RepID=A0A1Q5UQT6_9EURO|nr:uncharacterized protein N7473_007597 [Penicillium subrubescens]KAJ5891369.1 hypothetical protein N7473_007597 [Penicillium subrubescens]OKP14840.1 hypothetical protein PENSUB_5904 [Penicillium subrubescens]
MPDEPRRIIIEKSSTVRRRYQRSNKRFKFTASQLRRIEREEELERRAKAIKEKGEKRRANKKRKAEKEAKDREERKRLGLPDPNAPKIPASQPLLSAFLGVKPKQPVEEQPVTANADSTTTENEDGGDTEVDSAGGDTEAESDIFDDLDEDIIEQGFACLQDAGIPKEAGIPKVSDVLENRNPIIGNNVSAESLCSLKDDHCDDDEFSDCSVFDDADIIREADAIAASRPSQPPHTTIPLPTMSLAPPVSTMGQPRSSQHPKSLTPSIPSLGDSFRDDTADYLEDVFSRGCGDSFGELVQLGSASR